MRGITKRFPGAVALDGVDFDVRRGEVHILLGENGAGKSTLIKILTGVYPPDEGQILLNGDPVRFENPGDAQRAGIGVIYQEPSLIPSMTVAENIHLGVEPRRGPWFGIDEDRLIDETLRLFDRLNLALDPYTRVADLSLAERQMVAIARAVHLAADLVIMDEPTAMLPPGDVAQLFSGIRSMRKEGLGVLYVTHRLDETMQIGDRTTILRDGRKVATLAINETTRADLIRMIVGRPLDDSFEREPANAGRRSAPAGARCNGRRHSGSQPERPCRRNPGHHRPGGQRRDLAAARDFRRRAVHRRQRFRRRQAVSASTLRTQAIDHGIGHGHRGPAGTRPRARHERAGEHDPLDAGGAWARSVHQRGRRGRTSPSTMPGACTSPATRSARKALFLSGGTQQKVVLSRWLASQCRILLLDEPSRGIDVGARLELYRLVNDLTRRGLAVILVSANLQEIMSLADRVAVLRAGRLAGIVERGETSAAEILSLANTGTAL